MAKPLQQILTDHSLCKPYLRRIRDAYSAMDDAYEKAAGQYGFRCKGCEDSCCRTLFHHHTLAEMICLYQGYQQLKESTLEQIQEAAKRFTSYVSGSNGKDTDSKRMCPLNEKNRCLLYSYRPMICRLHGIPYSLKTPDRRIARGPGCWLFSERQDGSDVVNFDRTPFYALMAEIEKDLRRTSGFGGRIKLTVADMLALFAKRHDLSGKMKFHKNG